jgi:cytidylate kinase
MKQVIAIDGPAASGKSTVSRILAERLGIVFLTTGAIYRAATWQVLQRGIDPRDTAAVIQELRQCDIRYILRDRQSKITVNGAELNDQQLRGKAVNAGVSPVSGIPEVRAMLLEAQRDFAELTDLVAEGRDMGTRVFPTSPYKFFITASEEVRQKRREAEGLTDDVGGRDRQDTQRKVDPLRPAEDAVRIDTSELSIEQVVDRVLEILAEKGLKKSAEARKNEGST